VQPQPPSFVIGDLATWALFALALLTSFCSLGIVLFRTGQWTKVNDMFRKQIGEQVSTLTSRYDTLSKSVNDYSRELAEMRGRLRVRRRQGDE
jgi:hypothetical protein